MALLIRNRRAPGGAVATLPKVVLWALTAMTFSGWVATLAGWYTTEIGRQPWVVDGVLTTAESVADVPAPMVLGTLVVYLGIYVVLMVAYIGVLTHLARKAAKGETPDAPSRGFTTPTGPRSSGTLSNVPAE
jgi:cytochrome d ubiquinol oxidase subunit I